MIDRLSILSCLIVFFVNGCVVFTKAEGLLTLKRYGDSQAQMQRYVDKQVKLFDKLVSDLEADKLKVGISQRQFIRSYGEPVLSRELKEPEAGEVFLYRHPTEYFNTDRVYAYFDESKELIRWEYKPYISNEAKSDK